MAHRHSETLIIQHSFGENNTCQIKEGFSSMAYDHGNIGSVFKFGQIIEDVGLWRMLDYGGCWIMEDGGL